jgi:hypothetical protein
LGSARESRDWYYQSRFVLGDEVIGHRLDVLTSLVRLLLKVVPSQRQRAMGEPEVQYTVQEGDTGVSSDGSRPILTADGLIPYADLLTPHSSLLTPHASRIRMP